MMGFIKKICGKNLLASAIATLSAYFEALKKAIKNSLTGWYITWVSGPYARLALLGSRLSFQQNGARQTGDAIVAAGPIGPLEQMGMNSGSGDSLMLFGDNKNTAPHEPAKRSLLGRLFNPEFGKDIAPLKESVRMFVRMIAALFVSARLFPKEHPAFADMRVPLTMREVIGTAYSNLSFTKQGVPQVIYFFAVVGCLAFSAVTILMILMSLFVTPAQAQIFQAPTGDVGISLIDYLFQGLSTGNYTLKANVPFMTAVGQALSFYSTAVLVLAGVMLLYHLIFMVAETAHTGQAMGKADKIWAPIRLVVAIGLLVPIASSGGGGGVVGYNTGQYISIQIARWSSGLASNVWSKFASQMNTMTTSQCSGGATNSQMCAKALPISKSYVTGLVLSEACSKLFDHYIKATLSSSSAASYKVKSLTDLGTSVGQHYLGLQNNKSFEWVSSEGEKLCGGYEILKKDSDDYKTVRDLQLAAFTNLKPSIVAFVNTYYTAVTTNQMLTDAQMAAAADDMKKMIDKFQEDLGKAVDQLAIDDVDMTKKMQDATTAASNGGWLMAGSWFNTITRMQSSRWESLQRGLPNPIRPKLEDYSKRDVSWLGKFFNEGGNLKPVADSTLIAWHKFREAVTQTADIAVPNVAGMPDLYDRSSVWNIISGANAVNILLGTIDIVGGWFGLWTSGGDLALTFGAMQNPIMEMSAFGQKAVSVGFWLISFGILGQAAGDDIQKPGAIVTIIYMIASLMFLIGFVLGFVVPMYPFLRFFFGSLTWLMSVCEAVILMPIFALAHVTPYGSGLSGDKAKYGYSVLLQILLRPTLMIFGLILGYVLFGALLFFLNQAFFIASVGTGAWTGGTAVFAKLCYSIVYVVIVLVLAKECFSLIGLFPQVVLKWLGVGQIQEERFDTQMVAAAMAYGGSKVLPQMNSLAQTTVAPVVGKVAGPTLNRAREATVVGAGTVAGGAAGALTGQPAAGAAWGRAYAQDIVDKNLKKDE